MLAALGQSGLWPPIRSNNVRVGALALRVGVRSQQPTSHDAPPVLSVLDGPIRTRAGTTGVAALAIQNGAFPLFGIYWGSNGGPVIGYNNGGAALSLDQRIGLPAAYTMGWTSNTIGTNALDTVLQRRAAGAIEQRATTTPQAYEIANTWTSATNLEKLCFRAVAAAAYEIGAMKGSVGGTLRNIVVGYYANESAAITPAITIQTDGTTAGLVSYPTTVTAAGTTGAQTINKLTGTVNFAAAATSLVVTNSLVSTGSIVLCVVRTNDATAVIKNVVPAAGSFTITLNAAATAETSVGFIVIN